MQASLAGQSSMLSPLSRLYLKFAAKFAETLMLMQAVAIADVQSLEQ